MKKLLLITFVAISTFLTACSKSDSGTPDKTEEKPPVIQPKFEIKNISLGSDKIIIGQRLNLVATLADSTGNINYEWRLFFDGKQLSDALTARDLKWVKLNPQYLGEYTIRLTITRGVNDIHTLEKKFTTVKSNFQYGVWGDKKSTIEEAESDNSNAKYDALVGVPEITPGNTGLTYIIYKKSDDFFVYYFKDDKLFAGSKSTTFNNYNNGYAWYPLYLSNKSTISTELSVTPIETLEWSLPEQFRTAYEASTQGMSLAIGSNYLSIGSKWSSPLTDASLSIKKGYQSTVLLTYILKSK